MTNLKISDTDKLDKGFLATCDAVAKTLGAEGKLAVLENLQHNLPPDITKDGVSVAQRIRFADKFENFGALQAISAAAQTLAQSGDNTTTCLVFSQGFLRKIRRSLFNKKVERGIEIAIEEVKERIKTCALPILENKDILFKLAKTAANGDELIASAVLEAYDSVGYEGIVDTAKNYQTDKIEVITQNGMKFKKGYASPFFINNEQKAVWEAKNCMVLCLETWEPNETIYNFLKNNRIDEEGNKIPILIFMEKEHAGFREKLITLIEAGHLDCCLVIAPDGHSEHKCVTNIRDLALFTDATPYHPEKDLLKAGFADSITVTFDEMLVVRDKVSDEVTNKIQELKSMEQNEFLNERIQRLEGVSCLISVGGESMNDINEKFDRLDDSLKAVRTALPEGYIAGGGSTLIYISHRMKKKFNNEDVQLGYDLVKTVLLEPAKQILKNANRQEPTWIEKKIFGSKSYFDKARTNYGYGYNAKTDEISNLIEDGVLDSAKSIRVALQSAKEASIKMLLTQVIATFPEKIS